VNDMFDQPTPPKLPAPVSIPGQPTVESRSDARHQVEGTVRPPAVPLSQGTPPNPTGPSQTTTQGTRQPPSSQVSPQPGPHHDRQPASAVAAPPASTQTQTAAGMQDGTTSVPQPGARPSPPSEPKLDTLGDPKPGTQPATQVRSQLSHPSDPGSAPNSDHQPAWRPDLGSRAQADDEPQQQASQVREEPRTASTAPGSTPSGAAASTHAPGGVRKTSDIVANWSSQSAAQKLAYFEAINSEGSRKKLRTVARSSP